ncbi:Tumor necrosis factor receptor superfamily member 6 precursor [Salmo salar]|uniref:Tumor necrosis factor receptor superfamily member 6 n=1 Tax=Salmo salar TaxID=8030 RepID=C0HA07_SALSA|nr:Tumor necrosis factor receptor superfamily member 6 precursor [Salmo salar]ACN10876.1 Tumor necrosis factor receptor superfamily member 6 precursor [Salmo salar]|eukprot:NP_001167120.1 Tumor necrosis factor receptor superfamily member 6 precursor [Salmo salar]
MNKYTFLYSLCILCTVRLTTPLKAERSSQDILITSKLRTKRQSCQDGTYQHEGMACCLCAAGQHLERHCSVSPEDGTCVNCEKDRTYNSDPNSLDSCEPCTSCNPKANLEVEDRCTIFKDSVCRCQQGHYCNKGKEHCRACYPCTTCREEGIKVACTATNNTICNAFKEQGSNLAAVLVLTTVLLVALIVIFCLWKNNKYCFGPNGGLTELPNRSLEEMQPLRGVDLRPHLPDIAKTLGWKDMKQLAEGSGMTHTDIESHQLNFPNDSQEQCSSLLRAWVEKEGMTTASETLVQTLRRMKKKVKAEDIMAIISNKEDAITRKNSGSDAVP